MAQTKKRLEEEHKAALAQLKETLKQEHETALAKLKETLKQEHKTALAKQSNDSQRLQRITEEAAVRSYIKMEEAQNWSTFFTHAEKSKAESLAKQAAREAKQNPISALPAPSPKTSNVLPTPPISTEEYDTKEYDTNEDNSNALYRAVATKNMVQEVQALLKSKEIDLNAPNKNGNTPLHIAAFKGRSEYINPLLEAGANPNIANNEGEIPLLMATYHEGEISLPMAADSGHTLCVEMLAKVSSLDHSDHKGRTALHIAAAMGQEACVSTLLKNKVNPNLQDSEGLTALDWAIKKELTALDCVIKKIHEKIINLLVLSPRVIVSEKTFVMDEKYQALLLPKYAEFLVIHGKNSAFSALLRGHSKQLKLAHLLSLCSKSAAYTKEYFLTDVAVKTPGEQEKIVQGRFVIAKTLLEENPALLTEKIPTSQGQETFKGLLERLLGALTEQKDSFESRLCTKLLELVVPSPGHRPTV